LNKNIIRKVREKYINIQKWNFVPGVTIERMNCTAAICSGRKMIKIKKEKER